MLYIDPAPWGHVAKGETPVGIKKVFRSSMQFSVAA